MKKLLWGQAGCGFWLLHADTDKSNSHHASHRNKRSKGLGSKGLGSKGQGSKGQGSKCWGGVEKDGMYNIDIIHCKLKKIKNLVTTFYSQARRRLKSIGQAHIQSIRSPCDNKAEFYLQCFVFFHV